MRKKGKLLFFVLLFFSLGNPLLADRIKPKISLFYPESFPITEEVEILLSISELKNVSYDLKISIQKEKEVLSEIYNEKEGKWQSSLYYIKNLFFGPSFEGKFKLRLNKNISLLGEKAEIVVRVRESGKSNFSEFKREIKISDKILEQEIKKEKEIEKENSVLLNQLPPEKNYFFSTILIAFLTSLFSAIIILFLKIKLKFLKSK